MSMRKLFLIGLLCATLMSMQAQEQVAIFFDSNKFDLTKAEQKRLSDWISSNKEVKIVAINGYTDEDGSNGFNDTLAKKRVNFIYNQIKDQVKIRDDFKTRSFGENFTQSKNKAENRKVTLYYILQKDLARENEILGITPQIIEPLEIEPIEEESMNFPENATLEEKIALSRKGTLIRLSDINFYINTFAVMPTSKRSIDELIDIMNKNPKLKIEIQGHICCVNKDAKNLSTDRAKQIKRILVSQGIYEKRISTKGFGVSKPKFPIPEKSEAEAAQNRRVEIMVLDK
jgi:outer membrane protein OmpA-like peptidoglycan-associated protein